MAGTSPILYGQAANLPPQNLSPAVLASLGQVGVWGNAISGMPAFSKVNSTYLTSTFSTPSSIISFIGKIYVNDFTGIRQLYNGRVSDFTGIKGY